MPFRNRNIVREMGAAIAVLAIYVLVLLVPLHQAAGLQRDLSALGYASLDTWSICGRLAADDQGSQTTVVKCAASGIGKNELAAIEPVALDLSIVRVATTTDYRVSPELNHARPDQLTGQPRAPPMMA